MRFLANLFIGFNQLIQAVLHRVTAATIAAQITTRAQIGYNDDVNKIVYHDGTAVQVVASEAHVSTQITNNALTVAPASANLIDITGTEISLKALAIQKVFTDGANTVLFDALADRLPAYNAANVSNGTASLQEGDVLLLPQAVGGMQVYIHNGGTAGTTADFTLIETPNLDNAAIRALLSGTNGVTYNATTGQFKLGGAITEPTVLTATNNLFRVQNSSSAGLTVGDAAVVLSHEAGALGINASTLQLTLGDGVNDADAFVIDSRVTKRGLQYSDDYGATLTARSLIDKGNVQALIAQAAKRLTVSLNILADTPQTIFHNFDLADKDSIAVAVWLNGVQAFAQVETMDKDSVRITTSASYTDLKVFMTA
jgi:hypothetical protein